MQHRYQNYYRINRKPCQIDPTNLTKRSVNVNIRPGDMRKINKINKHLQKQAGGTSLLRARTGKGEGDKKDRFWSFWDVWDSYRRLWGLT